MKNMVGTWLFENVRISNSQNVNCSKSNVKEMETELWVNAEDVLFALIVGVKNWQSC